MAELEPRDRLHYATMALEAVSCLLGSTTDLNIVSGDDLSMLLGLVTAELESIHDAMAMPKPS